MYLQLNLSDANLNQLKCCFGAQSLYIPHGIHVIYPMDGVRNKFVGICNTLSTENSRKEVFNLQHYFLLRYWICL